MNIGKRAIRSILFVSFILLLPVRVVNNDFPPWQQRCCFAQAAGAYTGSPITENLNDKNCHYDAGNVGCCPNDLYEGICTVLDQRKLIPYKNMKDVCAKDEEGRFQMKSVRTNIIETETKIEEIESFFGGVARVVTLGIYNGRYQLKRRFIVRIVPVRDGVDSTFSIHQFCTLVSGSDLSNSIEKKCDSGEEILKSMAEEIINNSRDKKEKKSYR